jgi:hypothetical protein
LLFFGILNGASGVAGNAARSSCLKAFPSHRFAKLLFNRIPRRKERIKDRFAFRPFGVPNVKLGRRGIRTTEVDTVACETTQ